jgi:hypothetical protein
VTVLLLPPDIAKWHFLEERMRAVLDAFGFGEVRTPIVGPEGALRPPGLAPLERVFQERGLARARWYQLGPTFGAAERIDLTGALFAPPSPTDDAEIIAMLCGLIAEAGLDARLRVTVAGQPSVGALLDELEIPHHLIEGSPISFTVAAGDLTLCRGTRTDSAFTFTLEVAALVAAIPDPAASYVLPPAAVFVAPADPQALATAHRLRLSGVRIELAEHPADTRGARLRVCFQPSGVLVEDLETGRSDTVDESDLETTIRARMD